MSRGHRRRQRDNDNEPRGRGAAEFAPSDLEGRAAFLFSGGGEGVTAYGRVGVSACARRSGREWTESGRSGRSGGREWEVSGHFFLRWDVSDLMSRGVPRWRF